MSFTKVCSTEEVISYHEIYIELIINISCQVIHFHSWYKRKTSITEKDTIKIFVSQWFLYQIWVSLKVEPVSFSAQFFGTVHASRTVWFFNILTTLASICKSFMFFVNILESKAPFVNFDSKYSIINGPPIFGFFETFLYV